GTMIRLDQISYHLLFPALLLFCRQFFTTKKNFPVTDTLILTLIIIILVVLPLETLGYFNEFTGLLTNVFSPALAIAIYLITAIRAWKRRISGSAVVFSGAIIMLVAVGSNILSEYVPGFIHRDSVNAITHVAFLFEAILFASAIGIRQLEIRQQRDQALRAELISTRERLRLSEQLQSSRKRFDQAKKQAEARQLKLATLSHDLKQPLISLRRGLSALEIHGDANQRMHAAFDYLESLSQRQLDERPNADYVTTESDVEQFPINAVLDNVIAMFQAEAASKGLDLRYRSCDEKIHADPIEVMRIASNLVSNAIKHVQSGGVLVACRVRSSVVQLQVHDTGRGMSQSELNRCMLAYNRGDSSEGTGLGLHLVASLSHEAGFTFNAESKPGKGSSFSVSFPKA
ncbi:MAG: HAMP domain-containing histidine kinase, partial [Granulosicoccus sp.]|nr:HAMP domain-containing histidine kinase [Granulosicoccus sp.]